MHESVPSAPHRNSYIQNKLTELNEVALRGFSSLKTLNLYRNELTSLPDAISALVSLQDLDCSSNQLEEISDQISKLENLNTVRPFPAFSLFSFL